MRDVSEARPGVSRRDFLKVAGGIGLTAGVVAATPASAWATKARSLQFARSLSSSSTLVVAVYAAQASAAQKQLAADFAKQYPGVTVKFVGISAPDWNGFFAKVLTQLAAGSQIDAVNVATEGVQLFASKGLALPLDSHVMRDKADSRRSLPMSTPCWWKR